MFAVTGWPCAIIRRVNRLVAPHKDAHPSFAAELGAVYVGGAVGALSRYGLVEAVGTRGGTWPWATFLANFIGCAILGFVIAHRQNGWGSDVRLALIGTGFCGGLTTFSTFQYETWTLIDASHYFTAIAYVAASVVVGLIAVSSARRYVNRGRELA